MFPCSTKVRKEHDTGRLRHTSSVRMSPEDRELVQRAAMEIQRRAAASSPALEPEPEPEPGPGLAYPVEVTPRGRRGRSETQSAQAGSAADRQARGRLRTSVLPPWTRQKLSSDWNEDKAAFIGKVGKVFYVDDIGRQVELTFGYGRDLQRAIYPITAVGLRNKEAGKGQGPLEDAAVLLRFGRREGEAAQQWCDENHVEVQVRDDPKFVEECFLYHNKPFVEEAFTDWHAIVSYGVAFFGAFAAGGVTEALGLGRFAQVLVALPLWVAIAYNAIYLERRRVRRIELFSEREAKTRRERTSIPDEENVEWLNAVLRKLWGPLEPRLSKAVQWTAQATVDDAVLEPYLPEIKITEFSLGHYPPIVQYASYEPSEVYGEFKINMHLTMVAPEMNVHTLATLCVGGLEVEVPLRVSSAVVEIDMQLVVRVSEDQGLTMLGIMLNKPLELDYCLTVFSCLRLSSLPMVCGYLNRAINDSLWWMRKPEILMLPLVPSADLDTELSRPTRNLGLLQITVLQAHNLKPGLNLLGQTDNPYVTVSLRSKKDHSILTRKSGSHMVPRFHEKTLSFNPKGNDEPHNPTWGHEFFSYLKASECIRREHGAVLCFEVHDDDTGADRLIGEVSVDLWDLVTSPELINGYTQWLPLKKSKAKKVDALIVSQKAARGEKHDDLPPSPENSAKPTSPADDRGLLRVRMQWHKKLLAKSLPLSQDPLQTVPNDVCTGILEVTVKACRRLLATSGNKDDPYVSIDVGGMHELRTTAVREHSHPSWDEGTFDFPVSSMTKVIRIQVNDAERRGACIGSILRRGGTRGAPRSVYDFPSVSEFLALVGLLKRGRLMLMETADVWVPLNDPTTGKLTDQELHLQVAFRACSAYRPRCDAVFVTNIPMAWAVQPAADSEDRSFKLKQVLELAFYGPGGSGRVDQPRIHHARCPVCGTQYPCAAGRIREVYCPALQAYQAQDDNAKTWALVVVRDSSDAAAFVKARHFSNDTCLSAAAKCAGANGTITPPTVEMEALDPTPRHDDRFKAGAGADDAKTPVALDDLPIGTLHDEVEQHFGSYWSSYVEDHRVDGLLVVCVSNCTGLMWCDKR